MKKALLPAALAVLALASCTSDDYLGADHKQLPAGSIEQINFGGQAKNSTRGAFGGATAAAMLDNKFIVHGTLQTGSSSEVVFNNYVVEYNPSHNDDTNVCGWSYLTTPTQNIKYWNLSAKSYQFVAFSGYEAERIAETESNTLKGINLTNAPKIFMSDRAIATYDGTTGVQYGKTVSLNFKRLTAKVRFGLYETVPGYAVKNVRFYYGDNALTTDIRKGVTTAGLRGEFPVAGNYDITYDAKQKVVANLATDVRTISNNLTVGALSYQGVAASNGQMLKADGTSDATGEKVFLGTNSTEVSFAKDGSGEVWQNVLPFTTNDQNLVLRIDYDLVPLDGDAATPGAGTIHVYNASAVVPYSWAQWKPNYAYTYIFKISDQTSGQTTIPGIDPDKDTDGDGIPDIDDDDDDNDGIPDVDDPDDDGDGIPDEQDPDHPDNIPDEVPDPDTENPNPNKPAVTPIVFDAAVSNIEDFNQETITGVTALGGNAITTYSKTSNVTDAAEYGVGEHIVLSSPSHGRWAIVRTSVETTEQEVSDANTYTYQFIAGVPTGSQTIEEWQNEYKDQTGSYLYGAEFDAEAAGYYIVWLRYLPTGLADEEGNYVDVFKVIKIHE